MSAIQTAPQRAHMNHWAAATLVAVLLAACGGGGGPAPIPTVSSVTVQAGSAKYGQDMVIVVTGTDVDQQLFVTSPSCTGMYLSTTAPFVSGTGTAYYRCRVSALGTFQVTVARAVDRVVLGSAPYTVSTPQVSMTITEGATTGTMVFTLRPENAPLTVNNFLDYVNSGFYLGTVFHRVGNSTGVVQGGGYLPLTPGEAPVLKPNGKAPVALEVGRGLSNLQWTLGMARDPSVANSATSQFYINVVDNASLDGLGGGYAVFGAVSAGTTNVVTFMDTAPCTPFPAIGSECAPNTNIIITAAVQTQ